MIAQPLRPGWTLLIVTCLFFAAWAEARTFTMSDGATINGEVVSFKNGMIILAKDAGGRSLYNSNAFSEADQAYLRQKFPQGNAREDRPGTATAKPAPQPTVQARPQPAPRQQQAQAQTQGAANHPGLKQLRQGSVPPEIKGRIQGKADYLSNKDLRGRILVVHFWSTVVPQSVEEVKGLAYLHNKYKDRGFELIGVAMDGSQRRLNDVEEAIGVTWPMRLDEERATIEQWGVTALPTNVLIDQNGVILREHISARDLQFFLADNLGPLK